MATNKKRPFQPTWVLAGTFWLWALRRTSVSYKNIATPEGGLFLWRWRELPTSFPSPSLGKLAGRPSRSRLLAGHRCGLQLPHAAKQLAAYLHTQNAPLRERSCFVCGDGGSWTLV